MVSDPNEGYIGISVAPEDEEKKKKWAEKMANLQISLLIQEGWKCAFCGHKYKDVEDFKEKSPKKGFGDEVVCAKCWKEYAKSGDKGSNG